MEHTSKSLSLSVRTFVLIVFLALMSAHTFAYSFKKCSNEETEQLEQALSLLDLTLNKKLVELESLTPTKVKEIIRSIYPRAVLTTPVEFIQFKNKFINRLLNIQSKMRSTLAYRCDSRSHNHCYKGTMPVAFVLSFFEKYYLDSVYICPAFFEDEANEGASTLLHELAHLYYRADHGEKAARKNATLFDELESAYMYELFFQSEQTVFVTNILMSHFLKRPDSRLRRLN